jgi:hypothetical protein
VTPGVASEESLPIKSTKINLTFIQWYYSRSFQKVNGANEGRASFDPEYSDEEFIKGLKPIRREKKKNRGQRTGE